MQYSEKQCQPWRACWDVRICCLTLSWAFSDVTSPSMGPEGKRPPLRGHEKGTGRLSQHSALAWGLLKAQTRILPHFAFLFLFPLSLLPSLPIFPSFKGRIQHQATHIGKMAGYGCLYIYFSLWVIDAWKYVCKLWIKSLVDSKTWFVYCFEYGLHKQSYSQLDNNSFHQNALLYVYK